MRKFEFVKRYNETRKLVDENGNVIEWKLPARSTAKSGAYDFFAIEDVVLQPNEIAYIPTGIKVKMLDDEILILANRSSNPKKKGIVLASGINIIDADYYGNPDNDGEISLILKNITNNPVEIKKGDKTVQGFFTKFLIIDDDNSKGIRVSGIGSTGK